MHEFLGARPRPKDEDGNPLLRVLIFDQFEELFTAHPERWPDRREFLVQIGKLLAGDPSLRVLFAMREEYMAKLDPHASLLPEKLRGSHAPGVSARRCGASGGRGPTAAVCCTGECPPENVGTVAEGLVKLLLISRNETAPGHFEEVEGEFVEPLQLQIVCQHLWQEYRKSGRRGIPEKLPEVDDALEDYYQQSIDSIADMPSVSEEELRNWFGKRLITNLGTRGFVFREQNRTAGIPNDAVEVLSARHVIREELRVGACWYELSHDRFIEPISRSNQRWFDQQRAGSPLAQAELWRQKNQDDAFLLRGRPLKEAIRWAEAHPALVVDGDLQSEFLKRSEEQAQEETKQQLGKREDQLRRSRRLNWLIAALAASLVIALIAVVLLLGFSVRQIRTMARTEVQNLILQMRLEEAQDRLEEHLFGIKETVDIAHIRVLDLAGKRWVHATDDPQLELGLACGYVKRSADYARRSASNDPLECVAKCPKRSLEDQALKDFSRTLTLLDKSGIGAPEGWCAVSALKDIRQLGEAALRFEQAREYAQRDRHVEAADAAVKAYRLEPSLRPAAPELKLAASLLSIGQEYARQAETDLADEMLSIAVKLDPTCLRYTPQVEADQQLLGSARALGLPGLSSVRAAEVARAKGWVLAARRGIIPPALIAFREAVQLDPNLKLKPEAEVANGLVYRSRDLARQGEIEHATSILRGQCSSTPSSG